MLKKEKEEINLNIKKLSEELNNEKLKSETLKELTLIKKY